MAIERLMLRPKEPKLFDRQIQDLQRVLAEKCLFLNHVFGRCERLVKVVDGRRYYTPNVYKGGDEYILLTPDQRELGNYCFFVREDPEQVVSSMGAYNRLREPFSLIAWVDMRTVEDSDERDVYGLEMKIKDAIGSVGALRRGGIEVQRVFHRAENVFEGFTLDEVDNQFLMSPYYGIRIQFELWTDEDCNM